MSKQELLNEEVVEECVEDSEELHHNTLFDN